ncbi:phosphorylase family protein [Methylomicrobium sp. RS1]|uniref:phosphorylase family protein n=1 Tax=Candidatus Methylomicrobium oryzae TaxID=2802053 RepID=UPI0019225A74|nr:phosphorylase [Methylomicrobium sp. RS1]
MITGIVVALPEEIVTLTAKRIDKGHCVFIGDKILVACAGMGPKNAAAAAELLISKGASRLISWGCAAALEPSLRAGDLTLADRLLDSENEEIRVNQDWLNHTQAVFAEAFIGRHKQAALHTGLLTESDTVVTSGNAKKQLHSFTGALALDMESSTIAKVAHKRGLPFLAIRAIADPAGMGLPEAVVYATNVDGEIAIGKLLGYLLLHPAQLPSLIKLGLYFNKAKQTLKQAAGRLESIAEFNCLSADRQAS